MKNLIKLLGIIALVAIVGLSFGGCKLLGLGGDEEGSGSGGGSDSFAGTVWTGLFRAVALLCFL